MGHHLITPPAKKGVVEKDGLDFKFIPIDGIENPLCIICPVITAYPGVISPDNDMGASVIFSNNSVVDGLPGSCVPHGHGKNHQGNPVLGIIVLQQYLVTPHPHIRGNVIRFGLAHNGVKQKPIDHLQSALLEIFVGSVDGVSRLKGHHRLPSPLLEEIPRL